MSHDLVARFTKKLDDFTVSDYHGLSSPGLTCYLNSVLQVLFMTEDFREAVTRCRRKDSTIDPYLGRLFSDLQTRVAKTHKITKKLGITNVYEQRDAAEYFEKILCLTSPDAAMMFKGELSHKTTCLRCNERNDSRSFFWILPIAVEDLRQYSVKKGLEAYFEREKVCGDNKMYCNHCNKKQDANLVCEITQNPEILTLLLKRFTFDYKHSCYIKLHCKVDVPPTLDVQNCRYDLYALVDHFGNLAGGHYTAQIKSFETQGWYHFNDDIVKLVRPLFGDENKVLRSCTAYLLMYRKVSRSPDKNNGGGQEALCAHLDDEAEREEPLVPHHPLKDKICNGGENLKHLNGHVLNKSCEEVVWKKQLNQRAASGDTYELRLQTQKSNSAKLQKDGGQKTHEPNRQPTDPNSEEHARHLNTRGSLRAHWRADNVDCVQSDVKSLHVSSSGRQSSPAPSMIGHSHCQFSMKEATGCAYLPKSYRKSNNSEGDGERMHHVVTADGSRLNTKPTVTRSASPSKKRNPSKRDVKKEPSRC